MTSLTTYILLLFAHTSNKLGDLIFRPSHSTVHQQLRREETGATTMQSVVYEVTAASLITEETVKKKTPQS